MKKNAKRRGSEERVAHGHDAHNGNGSLGNPLRLYPSARELAREEAIQRYTELYDFAPTGYVSFDRSGRISEINLAAARLFGMHRERLIGMPFAVLVWREDTPLFLHHLLRCRSQENRVETELRLKDRNRQIIYAELCSMPTAASEQDGAMLFQTSIVDLTAHKQAELAIQEKEAELELIVTQTPFMLTRCTRDLRYRYVSRAYADLMGRKQEELAGTPIVEVLGKYGLAKIRPYVERVLAGETVTYEEAVPARNGKHFLSATYVPEKNERGEVIGWFASILDVTERKKAEERFRIAVEASPSGMIMVDQHGQIMLVNSQTERLFGYKRKELLGKPVGILMPERFRTQVDTVLQTKTLGLGRELAGLRNDGTEVPVEVGINPIRLEGKRFVLASIVDISERKKAQEKIAANLQAVTLLHELGAFCAQPANSVQRCLQKTVETAIAIANAEKGILQMLDTSSGALQVAAHSGFDKPSLKLLKEVKVQNAYASPTRARDTEHRIVEDIRQSHTLSGRSRDGLTSTGVRDVHSVPLKSTAGNLVGILSVYYSQPHRPLEREVGFMDLLGRQAADYLERKNAEAALLEAARQQAALYQLARRWQTASSLDDVYSAALDAITSAMRCDRASILLYDDQQVMRFVAWRGLSNAYREAVEGHSPWKPGTKNPQPTYIADMRFADIPESLKATMRREGIRAAAFIPLVSDSKLIGKFMMYHRMPHVFTDVELDLALTIARQLVQAIQHEQDEDALKEREKELARELQDQRELQKISSQLLTQQKIETIYTRILEATMALLRSDCASMQRIVPKTDELRLLAQKGFDDESAKRWQRIPRDGKTTCSEAFRRRERVIVPDLDQCAFVSKEDRASYRKSGIRSTQSTPLFSRTGELVGIISNHWREIHEPSKRELRLLDVLARQAADLIEWKRADDEVRASEARMRATVEQATAGVARCDVNGRITFANQKLCQMLGFPETELIGKTFEDVTHPEDLGTNRVLFRKLIGQGKPFEVEKRFIRKDGGVLWADVSAGAVRGVDGKTQSTVAVVVDVTARKKAEAELQKANEALEQRVRERTRELHMTNKKLQSEIERRKGLEGEILSVSDREQQRLGQELHDGLCQHLTAVAFMTRSIALRLRDHRVVDAADIEKVAELVNKAAVDTRNLSRALHRVDVDAAGLIVALQDLADREIWRTPCRLEVKPSFRIDDDAVAAHLYRIAREAVINANKHAEAQQIVVKLERIRKEMVLRVIDDGIGLPKDVKPQQGLGFHIMNYRAQLMGGRLEIESTQTGGTCVSCYLPVQTAQPNSTVNGERAAGANPKNSAVPVTGDLSLRHLARRRAANA
jgi:PAS domain S-box-containing protein